MAGSFPTRSEAYYGTGEEDVAFSWSRPFVVAGGQKFLGALEVGALNVSQVVPFDFPVACLDSAESLVQLHCLRCRTETSQGSPACGLFFSICCPLEACHHWKISHSPKSQGRQLRIQVEW